jgi:hypothetical protein
VTYTDICVSICHTNTLRARQAELDLSFSEHHWQAPASSYKTKREENMRDTFYKKMCTDKYKSHITAIRIQYVKWSNGLGVKYSQSQITFISKTDEKHVGHLKLNEEKKKKKRKTCQISNKYKEFQTEFIKNTSPLHRFLPPHIY